MRPGIVDFKMMIRKSDAIIVADVEKSSDDFIFVNVLEVIKRKIPISKKLNIFRGSRETKVLNIENGKCLLCLYSEEEKNSPLAIGGNGGGSMPIHEFKNNTYVEIYTSVIRMDSRIKASKIDIGYQRYIPEELGLTKIYLYQDILKKISEIK